ARLGIEDNNTTGKFLNQHFDLQEVRLSGNDDPGAAAADLAQQHVSFVLADLPADALLAAADAGRERGLLLFNIGATDERLREQDCRADVIHVGAAVLLAQPLVGRSDRSEEHTSELQSPDHLVSRLVLED